MRLLNLLPSTMFTPSPFRVALQSLLAVSALVPVSFALAQQDEAAPAVIALSETSQANETRAAEPVEIDEIIVYGEKLGRTLAETNSSVGLATRQAIEQSSDADLHDVVSQFGNVVTANNDREISIRGVPQGGLGGEGDTISVYLDGVALPSRAAAFSGPQSLWDVEQVEVLRGAQSTTQGRNSLAGSVVMRTRDPTAYWDARARAGVFSRDSHDYAFAGGGPLADWLRVRFALQDRYDNGEITNITRNEDDAGRNRTRNARGKISFTPFENYEALLTVGGSNNEFGDVLHDSTQGKRTATSNERYNEDADARTYGLEQRLRLGERWTVEAITGYIDSSSFVTTDYDRTEEERGISTFDIDEDLLSQELRAVMKFDTVRAVFGVYASQERKNEHDTGDDIPVGGGIALLNGDVYTDDKTRTLAAFAEMDVDFAEHWRLTLGGRLNHERMQRHIAEEVNLSLVSPIPGFDLPIGIPLPDAVTDALSTALPDQVPPDYDKRGDRSFTDILPKLGLTWSFSDTHSVALTYQEGYRSGGTSISYFGGEVSEFDPEYTRTVEFASRNRWFDDRLTLNANVFYTRWRDQQVTIGDSTSFYTTTANAGRSHLYGLEVESVVALPLNFEVFASAGLLDTEFDEFINQDVDYKGNRFPQAPKQTGALGLTLKQWGWVFGQLSVQYIGGYFSDPSNADSTRVPDRALLNARLGVKLPGGFSLVAYGRNLTDNENVQDTFQQVRGDNPPRTAKRYGESRTVGAVLEWQLPR